MHYFFGSETERVYDVIIYQLDNEHSIHYDEIQNIYSLNGNALRIQIDRAHKFIDINIQNTYIQDKFNAIVKEVRLIHGYYILQQLRENNDWQIKISNNISPNELHCHTKIASIISDWRGLTHSHMRQLLEEEGEFWKLCQKPKIGIWKDSEGTRFLMIDTGTDETSARKRLEWWENYIETIDIGKIPEILLSHLENDITYDYSIQAKANPKKTVSDDVAKKKAYELFKKLSRKIKEAESFKGMVNEDNGEIDKETIHNFFKETGSTANSKIINNALISYEKKMVTSGNGWLSIYWYMLFGFWVIYLAFFLAMVFDIFSLFPSVFSFSSYCLLLISFSGLLLWSFCALAGIGSRGYHMRYLINGNTLKYSCLYLLPLILLGLGSIKIVYTFTSSPSGFLLYEPALSFFTVILFWFFVRTSITYDVNVRGLFSSSIFWLTFGLFVIIVNAMPIIFDMFGLWGTIVFIGGVTVALYLVPPVYFIFKRNDIVFLNIVIWRILSEIDRGMNEECIVTVKNKEAYDKISENSIRIGKIGIQENKSVIIHKFKPSNELLRTIINQNLSRNINDYTFELKLSDFVTEEYFDGGWLTKRKIQLYKYFGPIYNWFFSKYRTQIALDIKVDGDNHYYKISINNADTDVKLVDKVDNNEYVGVVRDRSLVFDYLLAGQYNLPDYKIISIEKIMDQSYSLKIERSPTEDEQQQGNNYSNPLPEPDILAIGKILQDEHNSDRSQGHIVGAELQDLYEADINNLAENGTNDDWEAYIRADRGKILFPPIHSDGAIWSRDAYGYRNLFKLLIESQDLVNRLSIMDSGFVEINTDVVGGDGDFLRGFTLFIEMLRASSRSVECTHHETDYQYFNNILNILAWPGGSEGDEPKVWTIRTDNGSWTVNRVSEAGSYKYSLSQVE